jgi:hypothetical protein
MSDPFSKFELFCQNLKINSKELGIVTLTWWGTQTYFMQEVRKGIDRGVREFWTMKCRQAGLTTIDQAIAAYWLNKFPGTLGAMIVDDANNINRARSIISQMLKYLPRNMKVPIEHHNIYELELLNRSVLSYLVAGKRKKADAGDLGQGKGLNFSINTEVGSWADEKQLSKLRDSCAHRHPNRLFLYESTPNGFNHFYDACQDAKKATTQAFIFIGWWRHDLYRYDRESNEYRVYWDGKLSSEEARLSREVKTEFGYEIMPEQWAWFRLQLHEKKHGDWNALHQEHPTTEEIGWVMSGYKFFSPEKLTVEYKKALKEKYDCYRYTFGNDFVDTRLHPTTRANADLKVWEKPHPNGVYVVGADPAYGYNEDSDYSTAIVYRCYADRLVQVAEFSAAGVGTAQFAWVLLHIVGTYRNVRVNVELTGPGNAVFNELTHVLKSQATSNGEFANELSQFKHHFYTRDDSLAKSFAYHSKTGSEQKELMMNRMKDLWMSDKLSIVSLDHLDEMKYFARDGAQLEGRGGSHDDRVIATALAVLSYIAWARDPLMATGQTHSVVAAKDSAGITPAQDILQAMMKKRGLIVE